MDNQGVNLMKKAAELAKDGELSATDLADLEKTAHSDKSYTDNEKAFIASLKTQGADFVSKVKGADFDPNTFAWEISDQAMQSAGVGDKPKEAEAPVSFGMSRGVSANLGTNAAISTGDPTNRVSVKEVDRSVLPANYTSMSYEQLKGQINTPDKVAALAGVLDDKYDDVRGKPFGGDGPLGAQPPERTWERFNDPSDNKSGVCRDIHQMAGSLLPPEYEARQIGYVAGRTSHSLLSYKDPKGGGYGIVEYGRNYSPADITKALGHPAHSYEEALMAIRPEAKVIFRWSEPEKGQVGHVQSVFYTQGYQNYFESLNLNFGEKAQTYAFNFDSNKGLSVSGAVGGLRAKAGYNPLSPGDPTGQGAVYGTLGYGHASATNPNNYWGVSLGVNHRPNESSGSIGENLNVPHSTTLVGARFDWNLNPFGSQRLANNVYGGFNWGGRLGVGLPFNDGVKTDAGGIKQNSYGFDSDMITSMVAANMKLSYDVNAKVSPNLSLAGSAFVAPDIYLSAASVGMGNKYPLANIGANAAARYTNGPWAVSAQAQYVPLQVNNLDTTGLRTDVSYTRGRFSFSAGTGVTDSHEGPRVNAYQSGSFSIVPDYLKLNLNSQQQVVIPGQGNAYMPAGGTMFGVSLGGSL